MAWKVIAREHYWINGAIVYECYDSRDSSSRRWTATIRGYRNWKIGTARYDGNRTAHQITNEVKKHVEAIRDRIDAGDESVFTEEDKFVNL